MLITKQNNQEDGQRKRTIGREIKIGSLSLSFVTIVVLAALALFYLAQSTQSATSNYKIRELQTQKEKLQEESKRLEVESVRLKSVAEIQKSAESNNLEENKTSTYSTTSENTDAKDDTNAETVRR